VERGTPGTWAYAAALVVTIVCLALANVVLAYFGGLANVRAETPAATVLALVQGVAGALLAGFASRQLFGSFRTGDFWLKWIVVLVAVLFALVIVWLLATGKSGRAMTWTTGAGVAALIGTEVGRRIAKALFGRPPREEAAPLPD
jgi:membrane protease YdiL (CAAX protease family)